MTRDELAARIRITLDDLGVVGYSANDLNDSIQDGYDDYVTFVQTLEGFGSFNQIAKTTYYNLDTKLTDYLSVMAVYNTNTKKWLDYLNWRTLHRLNISWQSEVGEPQFFTIFDSRWIAVYPRLNTSKGSLEFVYKKRPPNLVGSTELVVLEDQTLEWYSVGDLLAQWEEYEKATLYISDYFKAVRKDKIFIEARESPDRVIMLREQFLGESIFDGGR